MRKQLFTPIKSMACIKVLRLILMALFLASISSILVACHFPALLSDDKVSTISVSEGRYIINPNSILKAQANGENDIFIPQSGTSPTVNSDKGKSVQWTQSEYLQIAQALHRFVWGEPIENWKLSKLLFRLDCKDVNSGPQFAHFELFKIVNTNQETRYVRDLWIEPLNNSVSWQDAEYYPNVQGNTRIDLNKLKISSDDALKIAEKNGGYEVRTAASDQCVIYITLSPESNWNVRYSGNDLQELFNLKIDITSGEIKKK
jgi:hypothetical protein